MFSRKYSTNALHLDAILVIRVYQKMMETLPVSTSPLIYLTFYKIRFDLYIDAIGSQLPTLFFVNFTLMKNLSRGKRRKLLWKLDLHSNTVLKRLSTLPIPTPKRKPPTVRAYQNEELNMFKKLI